MAVELALSASPAAGAMVLTPSDRSAMSGTSAASPSPRDDDGALAAHVALRVGPRRLSGQKQRPAASAPASTSPAKAPARFVSSFRHGTILVDDLDVSMQSPECA